MKEISRRQLLIGGLGLAAAALVGCKQEKAPQAEFPTPTKPVEPTPTQEAASIQEPATTQEPIVTAEPTIRREIIERKEGIVPLGNGAQFEVQGWLERDYRTQFPAPAREGWKYVEITGRVRNTSTKPIAQGSYFDIGEVPDSMRREFWVPSHEYSIVAGEFKYSGGGTQLFPKTLPSAYAQTDSTVIPPGFSFKEIIEVEVPKNTNDYSLLIEEVVYHSQSPNDFIEKGKVNKNETANLPTIFPEPKYQDISQPLVIPNYATISFIEAFTTVTTLRQGGVRWVPGAPPDVQETFISFNIQNNYGRDIFVWEKDSIVKIVLALKDGRIAFGSLYNLHSQLPAGTSYYNPATGKDTHFAYPNASFPQILPPGLTKRYDILINYLEGSIISDYRQDGVEGNDISKDDLQGAYLAVLFRDPTKLNWIAWKLP